MCRSRDLNVFCDPLPMNKLWAFQQWLGWSVLSSFCVGYYEHSWNCWHYTEASHVKPHKVGYPLWSSDANALLFMPAFRSLLLIVHFPPCIFYCLLCIRWQYLCMLLETSSRSRISSTQLISSTDELYILSTYYISAF